MRERSSTKRAIRGASRQRGCEPPGTTGGEGASLRHRGPAATRDRKRGRGPPPGAGRQRGRPLGMTGGEGASLRRQRGRPLDTTGGAAAKRGCGPPGRGPPSTTAIGNGLASEHKRGTASRLLRPPPGKGSPSGENGLSRYSSPARIGLYPRLISRCSTFVNTR